VLPYVSPINKALVAKLRALGGVSGGANHTLLGAAGGGGGMLMGQLAGGSLANTGSLSLALLQHGQGHPGAGQEERGGGKGGGGSGMAGGAPGGGKALGRPDLLPSGGEEGVARTVLCTIGRLALVSRVAYRPYVSEVRWHAWVWRGVVWCDVVWRVVWCDVV
jgi:hypothetical protein